MNKYLLLSIFFFLNSFQFIDANAQARVEKVDSSKIPAKISSFKTPFVPEFRDKQEFLTNLFESLQDQKSTGEPINIGISLDFNMDFESIQLTKREGKIFREIEISSPNSNTMSVNFGHIELSKSAELFIINDEESYILGPIISEDLTRVKNFDPGFIPGDKIRILLVENENEGYLSKVEISNIGHIIYDFFGVEKFEASKIAGINCTGIGCSASCLQNIACFTNMDVESKAVALLSYTDNSDPNFPGIISLRGTGYLVNNGAQNKRPLFLAMIHGIAGYMVPDLKFIFHYKSPQCNPTTNGSQMYFIQGATQLGLDASNDLRFLELSTNPGTSRVFTTNPVSYLGWSIIDEIIPTIHGIHHPLGDVQKYMSGGPAIPFQLVGPGINYGVWKYKVSIGFPETISSGSPALNQNKRVIGSLYGGQATFNCSNFTNYDVYSVRLSRSWSLLCQYLDPNNEGIVATNTITSTPGTKILPSVDGPNIVCSSSTFTLQNAPLDLSVSWLIIQGASLLSSSSSGTGKSATVSIPNTSVSGEVKIRFTVSGLCSSKTYDKTFWVGKPSSAGSISGGTYVYTYNILTYSVPAVPGATSYNWQLPSGWTGGGTGLGNSISVTVGPSSGSVTVTPVNSCAQGQSSSLYVTVNNCPTCREVTISPNPAIESILISPKNNQLHVDENFEIYGFNIYDLTGKLLLHSDQKIVGSPKRIEVSDLPKGMYIIHLMIGEGVVSQKFLVDR